MKGIIDLGRIDGLPYVAYSAFGSASVQLAGGYGMFFNRPPWSLDWYSAQVHLNANGMPTMEHFVMLWATSETSGAGPRSLFEGGNR
jgi:hypothetical protein